MGRLKTNRGPALAPFTKKEFWDILLIPAWAVFPDDATRRRKFLAVIGYLASLGDLETVGRLEKFLQRRPTIASVRELRAAAKTRQELTSGLVGATSIFE